jgi:hypothetical protein
LDWAHLSSSTWHCQHGPRMWPWASCQQPVTLSDAGSDLPIRPDPPNLIRDQLPPSPILASMCCHSACTRSPLAIACATTKPPPVRSSLMRSPAALSCRAPFHAGLTALCTAHACHLPSARRLATSPVHRALHWEKALPDKGFCPGTLSSHA